MITRLEQVADGVHRLTDGIVNGYLIEDDDGITILDTTWPRNWSGVEGAIHDIGRSLEQVRAVVLTHGHPDHVGAAEHARRTLGVPVHAHRREVDRARGTARGASPFALVPGLLPHLWRPSAFAFVLHATRHGFMNPTWVGEVTPFDDEDELPVPGRPRPVATPGHTQGHTAFHLADRGVLFSGDALVTLDVLTREEGPRLLPDALNGDSGQARSSLAALEGLDADVILPGHGEPWRGAPAEAAAQARSTTRET
ncbi:MBL fold metallo-hydrolase [soil metagenome]